MGIPVWSERNSEMPADGQRGQFNSRPASGDVVPFSRHLTFIRWRRNCSSKVPGQRRECQVMKISSRWSWWKPLLLVCWKQCCCLDCRATELQRWTDVKVSNHLLLCLALMDASIKQNSNNDL